jgi:hypothetical protein
VVRIFEMSSNQKEIMIVGVSNALMQGEGKCMVEGLGVKLEKRYESVVRWGRAAQMEQSEHAECA